MIPFTKRYFTIKKGGIVAVLLFLALSTPARAVAESIVFKDTKEHWAGSYISWAIEQKLTQGYGDGSFKPNKLVNEAEFLAMLLRAYGLVDESPSSGSSWFEPYYDYANRLGWPISAAQQNGEFRRGQAALLLASAASGKAFTEQSAVQWLLNEKISNGRTSATVSGFIPDGKLTRAEALTFFYNLKQHSSTLSEAKIPKLVNSLGGIALNDTLQKLQNSLGKPARIDPSEYGFSWHVYNSSYNHYMMFGVQNDRITALFSNDSESWVSSTGIQIGQTITAVKKLITHGTNAEANENYYAFTTGSERTTLFIDRQNGNKIAGMMRMSQAASKPIKSSYSSKLAAAFEWQLFDLANAERAVRGIPILEWDKLAAASAHSHSGDMSNRSFFNHTNPDGSSPFDRMKAKGVKYHSAAENIAAGYQNSIFTHYGWINSKDGHRETLLDRKLTRLGTGVAIGGSYNVYYTQNFYTP
ncbi:CAP-associated domain-containing protein [Paenibacillus sp. PL91]|uniref:CAP-associated domain-containing protein n=1 Tax=Paenibacillus sp. PL91 TaxID=2729538 RepID=UPI00145E9AAA|nr:CAP-associated domain-containing protein [Paenibacillus sp. PL91]MBC9199596.1 S-layer homology domain-containing protein [Paenibacillus sp. PL91]